MDEQVYDMIQARLKRICASEYEQAPKTRKGKLKSPLRYSDTVEQLIELSSTVLDMSANDAESVYHEITHGSIQDAFLRANPNA